MAKNLVEALGRDFFNERYQRALMLTNGTVVEVSLAAGSYVSCMTLIDPNGKVIKDRQEVRLPQSAFTGYEVFKAPDMGYRKIGEGCYFARPALGRSHASAFFADRVNLVSSRATRYLENLGGLTPPRNADAPTIAQLFYPTYDTMKSWDRLIAGEQTTLVLSNRAAIEPSVRSVDDLYDVMYDNVIIGSVGPDRTPRKGTPAQNVQLIQRILKQ